VEGASSLERASSSERALLAQSGVCEGKVGGERDDNAGWEALRVVDCDNGLLVVE